MCLLGALLCVCGVLGYWLLFTGVPARCVLLPVRCPWPLGSCSPVCPLGALLCGCGVLGHLTPVHRCAGSVCCCAGAVSWASWLSFTSVHARCIALRVRCPGPLGSCSRVCPLGALLCVCGVLGHLAPVHRCARWVCFVGCAVSWATWLPFTGAPARCVALRVRCPRPLGSCLPVSLLCVLCGVCVVPGHLAPVHRCARSVCFVACAVSRATSLLFTAVLLRCVVLRVRCPVPLGFCSAVCPLVALLWVWGVPGPLAPPHRCARSVHCFASAVSWATWLLFNSVRAVPCFACAVSWTPWLLFTVVPARCVVLRVRCPRPLGSCSPVCALRLLLCLCGVLGHLAPGHRCARSVCCVACAVSWAIGSWSPVCVLRLLLCLCGVLGHLAPGHRCPRWVCCVACAVSWATWLLFTGVPAWCVALCVPCPRPLDSSSPVFPLGVLCCVCGVLGHLAPVHRCARSVCCAVGLGPPLGKEEEITSASKTQPTLLVRPHAMQDEEFMGTGLILWT